MISCVISRAISRVSAAMAEETAVPFCFMGVRAGVGDGVIPYALELVFQVGVGCRVGVGVGVRATEETGRRHGGGLDARLGADRGKISQGDRGGAATCAGGTAISAAEG